MTSHTHMEMFCLCFLLGFFSVWTAPAEDSQKFEISGEIAGEFFRGMSPSAAAGDWAEYERPGQRMVKTIIGIESEGLEERRIVETRLFNAKGQLVDTSRIEETNDAAIRHLVGTYDSFSVESVPLDMAGKGVDAAAVTAFHDGEKAAEWILSRDIPLGLAALPDDGGEAKLVGFGWGDASFVPENERLSYKRLAEMLGHALPEPKVGEWSEFSTPSMADGELWKFRLSVELNDLGDGLAVSQWDIGEYVGRPRHLERTAMNEILQDIAGSVERKTDYFTLARETAVLKGERKSVLAVQLFRHGLLAGRLRFSAELPFPWLANAFFFVESPAMRVVRLLDWGWEEPKEYGQLKSEEAARAAIADTMDAQLASAKVGDWALYRKLDGGSVKYTLVEIGRDSSTGRLRYVDDIQETDQFGEVIRTERKGNTREEIINGSMLNGDVRSDTYVVARGETTVKGVMMPTVSVTGSRKGEAQYRIEFSAAVPSTGFVSLTLFIASEEPFWRLIDFGRE